ncbi:hypothetical protein A3Q56_06938, partial [Intoshia linei]
MSETNNFRKLVVENYETQFKFFLDALPDIFLYFKKIHSYSKNFTAYHFDRFDVALPGIKNYFLHESSEENKHAQIFMKYQNCRGGKIVLENIE